MIVSKKQANQASEVPFPAQLEKEKGALEEFLRNRLVAAKPNLAKQFEPRILSVR